VYLIICFVVLSYIQLQLNLTSRQVYLTAYCTQHAIVLAARHIAPSELGAVLPASAACPCSEL